MYTKGIAIIAVTRNGVDVALKIAKALNKADMANKVYAPNKYVQNGVIPFDTKLEDFIKVNFSKVSAIIAVMANGIVIRVIAPYIKSKLLDPAVLSVDVAGKFVTSLLSGHYGGANELAKIVAEGIGAIAVITTASDVLGKQSIETLAQKLNLAIVNPESLVLVNAAIVNGGRVVLVILNDQKVFLDNISGFDIEEADNPHQVVSILNNYDAGVVITNEPSIITGISKPVTILKIKKYTIGIGARKEIATEKVLETIIVAVKTANIPVERITQIGTIDIKKSSKSMIDAVRALGFDLNFISTDELRKFKHEDLSPDSKIVQKNIGIGGVCERAALILAEKNAHLILKKQKNNGVTIAIAEEE